MRSLFKRVKSSIALLFPLYAGYSQLYTQNKPCHYGIQCCSCSVFTVCATCNVISHVKYVLYCYISTSRSLCAVHNMAVFRSSSISFFTSMLFRYSLSDFSMVPVAPIVTGIALVFTFHMCCIYCYYYCYYSLVIFVSVLRCFCD